MRPSADLSWTNRTFIQLGILVFCILAGASIWLVHVIKQGVEKDIQSQLQTIQQAAHQAVHYWRDMNIESAISIANRPRIKKYIRQLSQASAKPAELKKNRTLQRLRAELKPFITQHQYRGFFVVARNQVNFGSMRDSNLGKKNLLLTQDTQSLLQAFAGETVISQPVLSDVPLADTNGVLQNNHYTMFVITPVTDAQDNIFALLLFRIAPAESFNKLLSIGRFGKSGETYMINKNGQLLSSSRFEVPLMQAGLIIPDSDSAYQLMLREPAGNILRGHKPDKGYSHRPLTQVVQDVINKQHHTGIRPMRDYRGVKVINTGTWDDHEGLGFITQIDYQEAFSIYLTMRNTIILVTGLTGLILAILVFSLISSRQTALQLVKDRTAQLKNQNQSLHEEVEERKKIQQALQNNQQRTTAILQSAFDAIIATDKMGDIEMVNPAAEIMFGYESAEMTGKNINILMPESVSTKHNQLIQQHETGAISTIVGQRREMVAKRKDGSSFPIELAVEETIIEGDKYFTSTISDITERKNMIERISTSEKEYRAIINNLNDTFYRTDTRGGITMTSPSAEQLLGYKQEEYVGMRLADLYLDPQGREKFLQALIDNHGSVEDYEAQLVRKDGLVIWVSTNAHFYTDDYGVPLGVEGTSRDITARKLAEQEIHESRQRLSFHIKQTPLGVIEWDIDFKVIEWNPAAEQIFGYSRNEVIGLHAREIIIPDEFKPHVDDIWHALLGKRGGQYSTNQNMTKLGERIWCEWYNTPLVDDKMNIIGVASMVMDISARKKAEEVLTRDHAQLQALVEARTKELNIARLEAEHANEAKSNFLANMSHELRTPIHTILSFAEIGANKTKRLSKEKLKQYFTNIYQGGERQLMLLNDLLDLSKLEAGTTSYEFSENDIMQVIEEQVSQHELMLQNKQLKIKIQPGPLETSLLFDHIRIEQVVRNLLSNAIKFSEAGKCITISLSLGEVHRRHDTIPALTVTLSDQGIGIPEDELESIFDKFVQSSKTRTGAGGTGLGLAICQEIITAHGGNIWAENNNQGGASFCFTLPIRHASNSAEQHRSEIKR